MNCVGVQLFFPAEIQTRRHQGVFYIHIPIHKSIHRMLSQLLLLNRFGLVMHFTTCLLFQSNTMKINTEAIFVIIKNKTHECTEDTVYPCFTFEYHCQVWCYLREKQETFASCMIYHNSKFLLNWSVDDFIPTHCSMELSRRYFISTEVFYRPLETSHHLS